MNARIYSPSKNAMQSGLGKTGEWVLEYESRASRAPEPLMGWTTGDTLGQVRLKFGTLEEAKAYAGQHPYYERPGELFCPLPRCSGSPPARH